MRRRDFNYILTSRCLLISISLSTHFPAKAVPPPVVTTAPPTDKPGHEGIKVQEIQLWDDGQFAGLPPKSHFEVLTWERVYTLALIHCRAPQDADHRALAASIDPTALAEQARRFGIADFERFRQDFLAKGPDPGDKRRTFVDPSRSIFDLLSRLQTLENSQKFLKDLEQLKAVSREAFAEVPGAPRLNRLDRWLEIARQRFEEHLQAYRGRLNAVKAELGLSPNAPVVPDRRGLIRFRTVFEKTDSWFRNPQRNPSVLPTIAAELPRLENVILGETSFFDVSETDPARREAWLNAAEQTAIKNRGQGEPDKEVDQRIRRRLKRLFEIGDAYQKERQRFLLALQAKNQTFEKITAPPQPGVVLKVPDLIGLHAQIVASESQLVALWASFQAEHLTLARDLRVLPGQDWKSFYAQIDSSTAAQAPVRNPRVAPQPLPHR